MKKLHIALLAIFVTAVIVFLFVQVWSLRAQQVKDREMLDQVSSSQALLQSGQSSVTRRLSYDAGSNMLYLPELKIRIPYSESARSLTYSVRSEQEIEVDFQTDRFEPLPKQTNLNCGNILRAKLEEAAKPYSPAEKPVTYKLQNGKSLQVYAFSGELEGDTDCLRQYETQSIDPTKFAKAFKGAEAY